MNGKTFSRKFPGIPEKSIPKFGNPEIPKILNPEVRESRNPENLNPEISGIPESRKFRESRTSGIPKKNFGKKPHT